MPEPTAEEIRLGESNLRDKHWKRWGPYLSERQWGTVREDYSANGEAWDYLPHHHAHLRAYRWGEDGLGGVSDRRQYICFALALWNGRDPILKERLFGVTGKQGNHAEDVKECYYYLDSTPTHSYMKYLYKYPQAEFPYKALVEANRSRTKQDPEFELWHTGVFDQDRYFDVYVEYAKETAETLLIRIKAINRGPDPAPLHLLPSVWFRNTWSWKPHARRPVLWQGPDLEDARTVELEHDYYGRRRLVCEGSPELLFTENETNRLELYQAPNRSPFAKDAFHQYVVHNDAHAVNPRRQGTKAAALYSAEVAPGESFEIRLRLTDHAPADRFEGHFEDIFRQRIQEADEFYCRRLGACSLSRDAAQVQRQAFAGLLWTKQFYHYDVAAGDGDPEPPPPPHRKSRNADWRHLFAEDILSMPDKWEYPGSRPGTRPSTASPGAGRPQFAKDQLLLFLREWYMHPNGQIPAYEWKFNDVNPPVHAWAARARLQDRKSDCAARPIGIPRRIFPQAAAQLHVVGEPRQGPRRAQRLPGRIPGPRQRRRLRPLQHSARPEAGAVGLDELDGDVLPEYARDRTGARQRESLLLRHRQQVLRALRVHLPRDARFRPVRRGAVG